LKKKIFYEQKLSTKIFPRCWYFLGGGSENTRFFFEKKTFWGDLYGSRMVFLSIYYHYIGVLRSKYNFLAKSVKNDAKNARKNRKNRFLGQKSRKYGFPSSKMVKIEKNRFYTTFGVILGGFNL